MFSKNGCSTSILPFLCAWAVMTMSVAQSRAAEPRKSVRPDYAVKPTTLDHELDLFKSSYNVWKTMPRLESLYIIAKVEDGIYEVFVRSVPGPRGILKTTYTDFKSKGWTKLPVVEKPKVSLPTKDGFKKTYRVLREASAFTGGKLTPERCEKKRDTVKKRLRRLGSGIRALVKVAGHDPLKTGAVAEALKLDVEREEDLVDAVRHFCITSAHRDVPAIVYATQSAKPAVVQAVIDAGADVSVTYGHNNSALAHAASKGYTDIVRLLLSNGAEVDTRETYYKNTPLLFAAKHGFTEIAKLLIAAGANCNIGDVDGDTPLHCAASDAYVPIVKALVDAGADVNATCEKGYAPLFWAAYAEGGTESARLKVVDLLVSAGARVNAIGGSYKWTPLHGAAAEGHTDIITFLLEAGADPHIKDKNGRTPRDVCEEGDNKTDAISLF